MAFASHEFRPPRGKRAPIFRLSGDVIVRAIVSIAFVWLMAPHEPDLGLDSTRTLSQVSASAPAKLCATTLNDSCDRIVWQAVSATARTLEEIRGGFLNHVERVRADFDANLKRP